MIRVLLAGALALGLAACGQVFRDPAAPIAPVAALDLSRYAGRWYEIARFPVWFQRGCTAVTSDYALRADGRLDVRNACARGGLDGPRETATAVARSVAPGGGRLKLRPFALLPVEGDYWVIFLDPDYATAVVATPSGGAGWILARAPRIGPERLAPALGALARAGYDLDRLTFTPQPEG